MREHQIVITLKPEQFLKVQRLAKDADAKSMGIFVRTKLLHALGIEGASDEPARNSEDISLQITELKRLHAELRGFVAESLALYETDIPEPSEGFEPSAMPINEFDGRDDELEKLADRTFAISPRLGAVDSQKTTDELRDPLSDLLADVSLPDKAPEEEGFHVPLAIRERRRQMAEEKPAEPQIEKQAQEEQVIEEEEKLPQRQRHTRHPKSAEEENSSEAKQDERKEQKSQDPPPPLSGSPPPKRKKT